jgi:hypothetical protein
MVTVSPVVEIPHGKPLPGELFLQKSRHGLDNLGNFHKGGLWGGGREKEKNPLSEHPKRDRPQNQKSPENSFSPVWSYSVFRHPQNLQINKILYPQSLRKVKPSFGGFIVYTTTGTKKTDGSPFLRRLS